MHAYTNMLIKKNDLHGVTFPEDKGILKNPFDFLIINHDTQCILLNALCIMHEA
jgi:hypothetical protein